MEGKIMLQFSFEKEKIYSVGEYLDWVNEKLGGKAAAIIGEVSKACEREKAVYFSIKDEGDGSLLNCLIWRFRYNMMGLRLEEGMKIKISGSANVYKPNGSLNFKADSIELAGEGAIKKAYDALKKKLEGEGIFAPERKRAVKKFPKKIGLITSGYGDAIHDFNMNLVRSGIEVKFLDCRVEGNQAAPDIIGAIGQLNTMDLDAIVITRGGGSWESLQAFNNEAVCRAIAGSRIPIVCGIGHEKDMPLACLAGDKSVSTPTAAAEFLSVSWKAARREADFISEKIFSVFLKELSGKKYFLQNLQNGIAEKFAGILAEIRRKISLAEQKLRDNNPQRLLDLGYSIVFKGGEAVGGIGEINIGDEIKVRLRDGEFESEIIKII